MNLDLKNKEWKDFLISEEFDIKNSKAYHKTSLSETKQNGISYITRTNLNNGVESVVKNQDFQKNQSNTIVFGAENATFFYQPNEYITGNKMYIIQKRKLNKYSGLFLQLVLNKSIENCGYGYGKGLIGSRVKKRYVSLPINEKNEPDFEFMETFMKSKEQEKFESYNNYVSKRLASLKKYKLVESIENKEWAEFFIADVTEILSGRDIYAKERTKGNTPYISSTANNNGIGAFVGNENTTLESECLSVNRNGSVGYSFYHPYQALFSNDCRKLRLKKPNKHVGIFISQQITRQRGKYGYGYKMGTARLKRQKIMLPINQNKEPDYIYMEHYMKNLEYRKLKQYLDKKEHFY
jgi:hypothetical protein